MEQLLKSQFWKYYSKICDPVILNRSLSEKIMFQGRFLQPEVCSEILHFLEYKRNSVTVNDLIQKSSSIYSNLDKLYQSINKNSENEYDNFYKKTIELIPWGHGNFHFDHDDAERRANFVRRGVVIEKIKSLGVNSFLDYGGGCGHFSMLATAYGINRVEYCEFSIFHPYVIWRVEKMKDKTIFLSNDVEVWDQPEPVDCVLCFDVAEHVYDIDKMMKRLRSSVKLGGYLFWVSVFGIGISCHIHPEMKGNEEKLLKSNGFSRIGKLPVNYVGHSGIFIKDKEL